MRDYAVTIADDGTVTQTRPACYVDEHAATRLAITLNSELTAQGISFYTLCFNPQAGLDNPLDIKIVSDVINSQSTGATLEDGVIYYPLPAALTATKKLDVQVQAHTVDSNSLLESLIKSPVFTLEFYDSVTGSDEQLPDGGSGFLALIYDATRQLLEAVENADALCVALETTRDNGDFTGATGASGADATINGHNAVTVSGGNHITLTQSGSEITLDAPEAHTHSNKALLDTFSCITESDGRKYFLSGGYLVGEMPRFYQYALNSFSGSMFQNTFYKFEVMSSINVTGFNIQYGGGRTAAEFVFSFKTSNVPTTLTMPATVRWGGGIEPTIQGHKRYEISIVDNIGLWTETSL